MLVAVDLDDAGIVFGAVQRRGVEAARLDAGPVVLDPGREATAGLSAGCRVRNAGGHPKHGARGDKNPHSGKHCHSDLLELPELFEA